MTNTVRAHERPGEASSGPIPVTIVCVLRGTTLAIPVSRLIANHAASTRLIVNCSPGQVPPAIASPARVQNIAGDLASFGRGLYRALQARFGEAAPTMQFDGLVVIATEEVDLIPLAQMLCADAQLSLSCHIESIVALADAAILERALREDAAARRCVAIADRLVLQLRDPASNCDLAQALTALRDINPHLSITLESVGAASDAFMARSGGVRSSATSEPAPIGGRELLAGPVRAYRVEEIGCLDFVRTRRWLTELCIALGDDLYRLRSVCCFRGMDRLVEFQGFGAVLGSPAFGAIRTDVPARSLITVSGRGLDPDRLANAVRWCNSESVAAEMLRQPGAIY